MDYKLVISKRKSILSDVERNTVILNHSNNVKNMHVCSLCGRSLSTYVPRTNAYVSTCKHYHFIYFDGQLSGNLCYNPHSCYERLKDKG